MMIITASRVFRAAPSFCAAIWRKVRLARFAPAAAAAVLAACATPAPPPLPVDPRPVEPAPVEKLVVEPEIIEPVEPEIRPGLTPPHMESRDLTRIALLLPFSAENAGARAESLRLLRAAELALFERAGAGLLMIPKDTGGTRDGGRAAAEAAIEDGAEMIIGPLFGPAVSGAGEAAREAGIPLIAFSTDASVAGDGVYLLSFPPKIEVDRIIDYAASRGAQRFAYLGPQNRYGQAVYDALRARSEELEAEIAAESFYTGDVEAMSRAAARLADGVFLGVSPEEAVKLRRIGWRPAPGAPYQAVMLPEGGVRLRTLAPLLISRSVDPLVIRFLGTGLWNDPDLLREPALHGGWFAGPDLDVRERFETAYEDAFGDAPSRIASLAYDAVALAAHLDGGEAGLSREGIEDELGFYGADGLFRFGADGIIERSLAVYEIRSRGFREIEAAPDTFPPRALAVQERDEDGFADDPIGERLQAIGPESGADTGAGMRRPVGPNEDSTPGPLVGPLDDGRRGGRSDPFSTPPTGPEGTGFLDPINPFPEEAEPVVVTPAEALIPPYTAIMTPVRQPDGPQKPLRDLLAEDDPDAPDEDN